MISKTLPLLLPIFLLALTSSCAVPIKDEVFYFDAGPSGAVTVRLLTTGSEIIPKEEWDRIRMGMACISPDAIGDFKTEIEKLCAKTPCSYDALEGLRAFYLRKDRIYGPPSN